MRASVNVTVLTRSTMGCAWPFADCYSSLSDSEGYVPYGYYPDEDLSETEV